MGFHWSSRNHNKIFVIGVARSGTTYTTKTLCKFKDQLIVREPFSPWCNPKCPSIPQAIEDLDLQRKTLERVWLNYDYDTCIDDMKVMFEHLYNDIPNFTGVKFVNKPYFDVYRELFPDCKFIIIHRPIYGRLISYQRISHKWSFNGIAGGDKFEYALPKPVLDAVKVIRKHIKSPWKGKAICAAYNEFKQNLWLRSAPNDAFIINYNDLVSEYDIHWTRLLNHCEIPIEDIDKCAPSLKTKGERNRLLDINPEESYNLANQLVEMIDFHETW